MKAIVKALRAVKAEEARLKATLATTGTELKKVRAVRRVLEQQAGIKSLKLAPAGFLEGKIMAVLDGKHPMSRAQIIEALGAAKYPYSLSPSHLTKTLTRLRKQRKVKRVGEILSAAAYIKARGRPRKGLRGGL